MNKTFKLYGSEEDLNVFETQFKDAGFYKLNDDLIQSSGIPIAPSIKYILVPGMGHCIKMLFLSRSQCMVGRGNILINGNLPVDEIERLLNYSDHFEIRNEIR